MRTLATSTRFARRLTRELELPPAARTRGVESALRGAACLTQGGGITTGCRRASPPRRRRRRAFAPGVHLDGERREPLLVDRGYLARLAAIYRGGELAQRPVVTPLIRTASLSPTRARGGASYS